MLAGERSKTALIQHELGRVKMSGCFDFFGDFAHVLRSNALN